ncbi:hypothetical protein LXL04_006844 [Taraxacum kok-saghyz]
MTRDERDMRGRRRVFTGGAPVNHHPLSPSLPATSLPRLIYKTPKDIEYEHGSLKEDGCKGCRAIHFMPWGFISRFYTLGP